MLIKVCYNVSVKTALRCLYNLRTTKFKLDTNGQAFNAFVFELITKRQIYLNRTKYFANTTTLF